MLRYYNFNFDTTALLIGLYRYLVQWRRFSVDIRGTTSVGNDVQESLANANVKRATAVHV